MIVNPSAAQISHSARDATAQSAPLLARADPAAEPHSASV